MTNDPTSNKKAYLIAEMSANHNGDFDRAVAIVRAMKEAGADAVKLQTYTADTLTIDCDKPDFVIGAGTVWEGQKLHDLYASAYTPWEWHAELFALANELGMDCFSTPFDNSAVDFLEQFDPPFYKVASFELVDVGLIEYIASKGRPITMSTGMGSIEEISDAVAVVKKAGVPLTLLKCTSAYPSPPSSMNLNTMRDMAERFDVPVGLSDHTLGTTVPVAAVALGASVVEKHFTLSRKDEGPDSSFSLEPAEFREMVDAIRIVEQALGEVKYERSDKEEASVVFRRSLYAVADIAAGEALTNENVRSIRPGHGLKPKFLSSLLGKSAAKAIPRGTPISADVVESFDVQE
ncbi:pseudaminic acid synthase [Mariniblastus fucicola]|uniref:Pseudaminic acid synthase n=1 Tax=Mariniblastus fucicola TaxID=980251 RepID=A0A5B9PB17_9BACT|nr:pseudaminic acid synthase [Mariniblastus fucicola]QEG20311.1 Pseudaminic acid synthase [Mariniblastus fucicola]